MTCKRLRLAISMGSPIPIFERHFALLWQPKLFWITVFARFVARALFFFQSNLLLGPNSNGPLFKHGRLLFSK